MPKVSVVTFVYNGEKFLAESIDSILKQSFDDFEYLIIDDGSTDKTPEIIEACSDSRVRCIRLPENKGRPFARNTALDALAAANDSEYTAWIDADDIAVPDRLKKQVDFLDAHKDVAVLGGHAQCFHESEHRISVPTAYDAIKAQSICQCPILASTACVRRLDVEHYALRYHEELLRAQDYAYYVDMLLGTPLTVANLPDVLIHYRYAHRLTTAFYHVKAATYVLRHLGFAEHIYTDPRACYMHTVLSRTSFDGAEVLTEGMDKVTLLELMNWANGVYEAVLHRNDISMKHFCRIVQYKVEALLLESKDVLSAFRAYTRLPVAKGHDLPRLLKALAARGCLA